jgi:hypothetical protein
MEYTSKNSTTKKYWDRFKFRGDTVCSLFQLIGVTTVLVMKLNAYLGGLVIA